MDPKPVVKCKMTINMQMNMQLITANYGESEFNCNAKELII